VLKGAQLPLRQDRRFTGQQGVAARKSQLRIAVAIRGTGNGRHTRIAIGALPTTKDSNVGMGQITHRNIGHFGTCNLAVGFLPTELAQWVGVPIGAASIGGVALVRLLAVHLTRSARTGGFADTAGEVVHASVFDLALEGLINRRNWIEFKLLLTEIVKRV